MVTQRGIDAILYEMEQRKQFETQGYVVLNQFVSHSEIENIIGIVNPIYQQWLRENMAAFIEHQLVNMHSLTSPKYFSHNSRKRSRFFDLIASVSLTQLLESMFGQGIYSHNTQLFFNPYQHQRSSYWHRDLQESSVDDEIQAQEQHNHKRKVLS